MKRRQTVGYTIPHIRRGDEPRIGCHTSEGSRGWTVFVIIVINDGPHDSSPLHALS